jgi:F-type H+-transporting ATPase subunit delta
MKTAGAKRIASRYVKALFEVAHEASALDAVEKDMASLGRMLAESEDFRQFLVNPLLTRQVQTDTMVALLGRMKAHKAMHPFVATLSHHRRLPILPEIIALFAEAVQSARGEMAAELIAASALKPIQVASVEQRLSQVYGKKVNLDVRQDPSLLGGIVVKIGSLQIDGSLAGKLERLELALKVA